MKKIFLFLFALVASAVNGQVSLEYNIDPVNPSFNSVNTNGTFCYNRNYLKDWDAQISKLIQATTSKTATAIWIGDSWTINGNITQPVCSYLRNKFGDAGVGYFGAGSGNQGNSTGSAGQSASITRVGTWTNVSQNTYVRSVAIAADSSSVLNDSIYYVGRVTDVVIHYMKKSSGGSFVTRIDGTSPTTVSTAGTIGLNFSFITGLTDGTHTISIKVSSAGNGVLICGAELNRNQNGVRIHNLGTSGSTATEWIRQDSSNWATGLQQLAPNLCAILLGVNDASQSMTTSTYIGNITRIVNRVKAAMPYCSILLISPSDIGNSPTYSMSLYVDVLKSYALTNNYGFIDNFSLIGDYASANARGLYTNTTHVNSIGGEIIKQNLLNWLNNGQSMYYSNGNNLAIGESVLQNAAASGTANVGIGYQNGLAITTGAANTSQGYQALKATTTGTGNCAFGYNALLVNTTASGNCAFGWNTLASNITGSDNCAFGEYALKSNTGSRNSSFGRYALNLNTSGTDNTAMGRYSLYNNASGSNNVSIGSSALQTNTGSYNTVIGTSACAASGSVNANTAIGYAAMGQTSGGSNTALGYLSGYNNLSGSNNIFIGAHSGRYETGSNILRFDNQDRSNIATERTNSIIWGTMAASPSNQSLRFNAATGLNTDADASAALDVSSTTKGFLPPRMTATQGSAISSPAEGLMIYVTNTNGTFTAKGWWGYDGAAWQKLNN